MLETWDSERIVACTTGHSKGLGPHHPWVVGLHANLDTMEAAWLSIEREVRGLKTQWDELLEESDAVKVEWTAEGTFQFSATKRRAAALATVLKTRRKIDLEHAARGSAAVAILDCAALRELCGRAKTVWGEWEAAVEATWAKTWDSWQGSTALVDWLGQLDTDVALAACAEEYGYVRPVYEEVDEVKGAAGLAVVGLRHPILERVHSETPYISHSIALGSLASGGREQTDTASADQGILLYGVNAAGKSSLSKAIGLAVLMAQIGMPVPATEMHIAPYKSLFTRILGNDNLWAGMSSFVVEMTEFRSILKAAGPTTLVLGDELCAGTETVSAMAIVGAGIKTLVGKGAQFVFATHLHELMTMPELTASLSAGSVRAYHLSVVPDMRGRLIYDRKLKEGSGSPIYGLEVCRGLDMDAEFLEAAMEIRRRLEGARGFSAASRYNAAVPVQACSVCGRTQGTLETHHIRPQAAADVKGRVEPGRHKNEAGNLVVLCESCHDAHHRGDLDIRGWIATTEGRILDLSTPA
jgi:DNA mismatch repair protein MutS